MFVLNPVNKQEVEVDLKNCIKQKRCNLAKEWCITLVDGTLLRSTVDARFFDENGNEWQEVYKKVSSNGVVWADWTKFFYKF